MCLSLRFEFRQGFTVIAFSLTPWLGLQPVVCRRVDYRPGAHRPGPGITTHHSCRWVQTSSPAALSDLQASEEPHARRRREDRPRQPFDQPATHGGEREGLYSTVHTSCLDKDSRIPWFFRAAQTFDGLTERDPPSSGRLYARRQPRPRGARSQAVALAHKSFYLYFLRPEKGSGFPHRGVHCLVRAYYLE